MYEYRHFGVCVCVCARARAPAPQVEVEVVGKRGEPELYSMQLDDSPTDPSPTSDHARHQARSSAC